MIESLCADLSFALQWVEASDLEPEAQTEKPKEFHAAWQAVCTAK
jgi:CTP synthase